jgi:hypothetical protein
VYFLFVLLWLCRFNWDFFVFFRENEENVRKYWPYCTVLLGFSGRPILPKV